MPFVTAAALEECILWIAFSDQPISDSMNLDGIADNVTLGPIASVLA